MYSKFKIASHQSPFMSIKHGAGRGGIVTGKILESRCWSARIIPNSEALQNARISKCAVLASRPHTLSHSTHTYYFLKKILARSRTRRQVQGSCLRGIRWDSVGWPVAIQQRRRGRRRKGIVGDVVRRPVGPALNIASSSNSWVHAWGKVIALRPLAIPQGSIATYLFFAKSFFAKLPNAFFAKWKCYFSPNCQMLNHFSPNGCITFSPNGSDYGTCGCPNGPKRCVPIPRYYHDGVRAWSCGSEK